MRQRRFMAGILVALFMFWTLGANAIATESSSSLKISAGNLVESTTGAGIDVTTGTGIDVTTGTGIDVTTGTGVDVTTGTGIDIPPSKDILTTSESAVDLNISSITVSKAKVSYGDTVGIIVNTTTDSAIGLSPKTSVCYTTGSGTDVEEKILTLTVEPDGTYRGVLDVDESIKLGVWKVNYVILQDNVGNELQTFNSILNNGKGKDLSAADFEVFGDVVYGFKSVQVSNSIAKEIDNIGITVATTTDSSIDLAPEAYVCYTTGEGKNEVEKQLVLALGSDGSYNGNFIVDEATQSGTWKVKYAIVNDKNGNVQVTYNSDVNTLMGVSMSSGNIQVPEAIVPEFKSISVSDDTAHETNPIDIVVMTTSTTAKDLAPEAFVCYKIGNGLSESEKQLTLKLDTDGSYKGVFKVDESTKTGMWKVKYVIINDLDGNVRVTYSSEENIFTGQNMSAGNIEVIVAEFNELTISNNEVQNGDILDVTVSTTTDSTVSLAAEAYVCYVLGSGVNEIEKQLTLKLSADGTYKGSWKIDESTSLGIWKAKYVIFSDLKGNVQVTYNSALNHGIGKDMSKSNLEVQGILLFNGVTVSKNSGDIGDIIDITVNTTTGPAIAAAPEAYVCYTLGSGTDEIEKQVTLKGTVDGTYKGELVIDESISAGIWKIKYIIVMTDQKNVEIIYNSTVNAGIGQDLSVADILVTTNNIGFKLENLMIDNKTPRLFENVNVTIKASNGLNKLADEATVCYMLQTENGPIDKSVSLKLVDGKYVGTIEMDNTFKSGLWKISYIIFENVSKDVSIIYNTDVHEVKGINLKVGDFKYVSPLAGLTINGSSLYNFDSSDFSYDIPMLPWDTVAPIVDVVSNETNSTMTSKIQINNAIQLPGTAEVIVTSVANSSKSIVYRLNFNPINTGYSVEYLTNNSSLKAGKLAAISMKITNNSGKAGSPVLVMALYDKDGALVDLVKTTEDIQMGQTKTLTTNMLLPTTGKYTVKAFVWESNDKMRSLAKYKEFIVQP